VGQPDLEVLINIHFVDWLVVVLGDATELANHGQDIGKHSRVV
jgi:hypothetical protein